MIGCAVKQILSDFPVPPELDYIEKGNRHITVKAGSVAIFEVPFKAYPLPEVTWKHNRQALPKAKRVQHDLISCLATLRLRDCEIGDAGEYAVTLTNEHGELSTAFKLTVLDKPEAPKDLKINNISEDSITLSWLPPDNDGGSAIKGYVIEKREASRRTWQKAGTTRDNKFAVDSLIEGQPYYFQVRAENEFGLGEPVQITQSTTPAGSIGKSMSYLFYCLFISSSSVPIY